MSTAGSFEGPGLDSGGLWDRRTLQRSRTLARTYLLSYSVPPLSPTSTSCLRNTLRLPTLAAFNPPRHRTTTAAISIHEPSLFTQGERAVLEGFSRNCRSSLQRRPPPPLLCKSGDTGGRLQSTKPVYTHFACPIRPAAKLEKPCRQSQSLSTQQKELRPMVLQYRKGPQGGALAVRGTHCLPPNPPAPLAAPAPARTQLHVFLPTEGAIEGEEGDSESVDEGFMDELDSKGTSLTLHQGASKTPAHPDNVPFS